MTGRPKRERKQPVRYGFDGGAEKDEDDVVDLTQEQPKPKRRATRKAVKQESCSDSELEELAVEFADDYVASQSESEHEDLSAPLPRGWAMSVDDRGRTYYWNADSGQSQWSRPTAPAEAPTPSLANPVAAPAVSPVKEPGPRKKITATRAKSEYKLTEADLQELDCDTLENPHGEYLAPMRLFKEREVYRVAMLKHGSADGLIAARNKSKERGQKMAETRRANATVKQQERAGRQQEATAMLARINGSTNPSIYTDTRLRAYIEKGVGNLATIEALLAQRIVVLAQQAALAAARQGRLSATSIMLNRLNLPSLSFYSYPGVNQYIEYGQGDLKVIELQLVEKMPELRREQRKQEAQTMLRRSQAPQTYLTSDHELAAYVATGEGSLSAIQRRIKGLLKLQSKRRVEERTEANKKRMETAQATGTTYNNPQAVRTSHACVVQGCRNLAPVKCPSCVCGPHAKQHCIDRHCTKHNKKGY